MVIKRSEGYIINDLQKNNLGAGTTTKKTVNSSIFLGTVTQNEIINAISKLNNKKCSGPDDATDEILKLYHKDIKGDEELVSNYIHFANLSAFSKVLETVIAERVQSYLTSFNIIAQFQFGFIYRSFDEKLCVMGIFFDISKAFDMVDHKILSEKLEIYGIRGKVLNKLVLNESKTSLVQFRTNLRTELHSNSAYFNSFTPSTKFKGILIDDNLKWRKHIEELEPKLCTAISAIKNETHS
ncbi:putative RNA-directed DNA polymerase from transposon X-element [Frankliniella fusca]|uniref:RNA-directed DNA polymerase from transposon X-element n=1 Tax=Frankliniella fusca TaxID=407009 RepID=A0AAE1I3V0_9NEOP|nr:putative RNA-directed DNA polymerase from transposon X-element [Frankliniella fusca]